MEIIAYRLIWENRKVTFKTGVSKQKFKKKVYDIMLYCIVFFDGLI